MLATTLLVASLNSAFSANANNWFDGWFDEDDDMDGDDDRVYRKSRLNITVNMDDSGLILNIKERI